MKYISFISSLIVNSLEEIRQDLLKNIFHKFPIHVLLNPDQYNPPFITTFLKLVELSPLDSLISNFINIACLFLDIFYGFFRLFISIFICSIVTVVHFLVIFWLLGILLYRWQPVSPSILFELSPVL